MSVAGEEISTSISVAMRYDGDDDDDDDKEEEEEVADGDIVNMS